MGIMVYSLLWVMQDLHPQSYGIGFRDLGFGFRARGCGFGGVVFRASGFSRGVVW